MVKVGIPTSIVISLICMFLAVAPFTAAISGAWLRLVLAGFIGYKGFLQSSLILVLINTLAVIGSPSMDISNTKTLIFVLILFSISFAGVLMGVSKLILQRST